MELGPWTKRAAVSDDESVVYDTDELVDDLPARAAAANATELEKFARSLLLEEQTIKSFPVARPPPSPPAAIVTAAAASHRAAATIGPRLLHAGLSRRSDSISYTCEFIFVGREEGCTASCASLPVLPAYSVRLYSAEDHVRPRVGSCCKKVQHFVKE